MHIILLSPQAIEILQSIHSLTGQEGEYVFTNIWSTTVPGNTINATLRRMGYEKDDINLARFPHHDKVIAV